MELKADLIGPIPPLQAFAAAALPRACWSDSAEQTAANFTPEPRPDNRFKVPRSGRWRAVLNTDAAIYGGSNVGNGSIAAVDGADGPELNLVLPPLGALFLVPEI